MNLELCKIYMEMAWKESNLSLCSKKKVGSCLVKYENIHHPHIKIAGLGYGGWIEKCDPCVKKIYEWQQDGCRAVHAEMRAIRHAIIQNNIKDFSNTEMYVTHGPCDQCIKHCIYFGIPKMIFQEFYHNDYSKWKGYIEIYQLRIKGTESSIKIMALDRII